MKTTTEMQLVPITKLVPYVNNARTHSPEQINKLRSSLREFGFINPVIIDRDFGVIAGHGRILAAKEEGIAEVPCVFADHLTEAQKKAYILADNRMAMDAGWDEELLRVEIEALQAEAFDLSLTGFGPCCRIGLSFECCSNSVIIRSYHRNRLPKLYLELPGMHTLLPQVGQRLKLWAV